MKFYNKLKIINSQLLSKHAILAEYVIGCYVILE